MCKLGINEFSKLTIRQEFRYNAMIFLPLTIVQDPEIGVL